MEHILWTRWLFIDIYFWGLINERMIYSFNKGLRIYGGVLPPIWQLKDVYFYLWYEFETLQVKR